MKTKEDILIKAIAHYEKAVLQVGLDCLSPKKVAWDDIVAARELCWSADIDAVKLADRDDLE
jgi:hypothetical protein